jgi:predicted AlkP superfamily pyrophosphatase or phosphodiesterase
MKKIWIGLTVALASVAQANSFTPHRPKLILAIIVDQFRYDYTTRFRARYTAGLSTLLENGAVFVDAHQDHYPTVTATGHATFMSGSVPATCGIINNEWYDRGTGKIITSVEDAATRLVGVDGDRIGSSPHNLIVSTLGDEIKMAGFGESKTIGISMKDRAAILPAGRMANASYWFDSKTGTVVSSTYYMQQLPSWVRKFNDERWPQKSLGAKWYAGNSKLLLSLPAAPNAEFYSKWEQTPYANDVVEHLAEEALTNEQLGQHASTDLLTVSFSANDHLGHAVGPDDPAVEEMSVKTDEALGKLISAAEQAAGGKENLIVVMSADHGVAPKPETMQARHMPGGRISKKEYQAAITEGLSKRFGDGNWILAVAEGGFYLNYATVAEKKLKLDDVEDALRDTARDLPYVARVYTAHELLEHTAPASEMDKLVARGYFRQRSPDVLVVMKPYYLFGSEGSSHGTPYDYDTHVPLIFFGAGIKPGTYYENTGISDVAPTLAALLQVETPSGSVGHILTQITKR